MLPDRSFLPDVVLTAELETVLGRAVTNVTKLVVPVVPLPCKTQIITSLIYLTVHIIYFTCMIFSVLHSP